jgi:Rrf2 family protein
MAEILKISDAASLGLHAMAYLASVPEGEPASAGEMARQLGVSEAHLAKVMQRLSQAGLTRSKRGPRGGFVLAKRPEEITLLDIYEAIEGPLRQRECLLGRPVCRSKCILGGLMGELHEKVYSHFSRTLLSDFTLPLPIGAEGSK